MNDRTELRALWLPAAQFLAQLLASRDEETPEAGASFGAYLATSRALRRTSHRDFWA